MLAGLRIRSLKEALESEAGCGRRVLLVTVPLGHTARQKRSGGSTVHYRRHRLERGRTSHRTRGRSDRHGRLSTVSSGGRVEEGRRL